MKGNKGEWSEIYTFLKLLADGKLHAADANLEKIDTIFYPVLKIIREENQIKFIYIRNSNIKITKEGSITIKEENIENFQEFANKLLRYLKESNGRSFEFPDVEQFLKSIMCNRLKSQYDKKEDITIVVHDPITGFDPTLNFSIKSQLGSPSTLLNPSKPTNFRFRITDLTLTDDQIIDINNISTRSKIKDKVNRILSLGGKFDFIDIENETFESNLKLIDSNLPFILGKLLILFFKGKGGKLSELIQKLIKLNPCDFASPNKQPFYEYKIKKLLLDIALGMTPTHIWTGKYDATGGYIIVKNDGEILSYFIYNLNEFQDYLLNNTMFDTPSSSRYEFGNIYRENNELFIKLNLQIRFIS